MDMSTTARFSRTFYLTYRPAKASLVAQLVKDPPAMRETWVPSLSREDSLEEGMATHSSILAWRVPWTEASGGLQSWGCKESDTTEAISSSIDL